MTKKSNDIFHNLNPAIKPKGFFDAIKWFFTSNRKSWPGFVQNTKKDFPPDFVKGDKTRVSFIGHHSFLIQSNNLNILLDPVWSERASPFSFIGPKRVSKPGIDLDNLPNIDIILISHNHYDHLDINTLKEIYKRCNPKIITPLENDKVILKAIPDANVETLNWYENTEIKPGISIHLEPAQHWSARGVFDRNKALWGSFIINFQNYQIYFAGDSGYDQKMFQDIASKYPNISLSIIPIGAYEPRWFMSGIHMNPEEAIKTHLDLKSKYSIAGHFGTFQLTEEGYDDPVKDLEKAKKKFGISSKEFTSMKIGAFLEI